MHIYFRNWSIFPRSMFEILQTSRVQILKQNIVLIICNLEKIFPPSFFYVMEHLPIHLPYEAELGGPVQYRWIIWEVFQKVERKSKEQKICYRLNYWVRYQWRDCLFFRALLCRSYTNKIKVNITIYFTIRNLYFRIKINYMNQVNKIWWRRSSCISCPWST